jgi:hypothetical protein
MQETQLQELLQDLRDDVQEFGCLSLAQMDALLKQYQGDLPITKSARKSFIQWATTSPIQEIYRCV